MTVDTESLISNGVFQCLSDLEGNDSIFHAFYNRCLNRQCHPAPVVELGLVVVGTGSYEINIQLMTNFQLSEVVLRNLSPLFVYSLAIAPIEDEIAFP